jgi:hypothetical protein
MPAFLSLRNQSRHEKSILISPPDVDIEHLLPPYIAEKVQALSQWFDYWRQEQRQGKVDCDDVLREEISRHRLCTKLRQQ